MAFVRVIAVGELPPGERMEARVGDRVIALFNVGGTVYATAGQCPHRGGPLGQGYMDGCQVMCPWHAWIFDVTTGENTSNPEIRLETFPVILVDGEVRVDLPARRDSTLGAPEPDDT